MQFTSVNPYNGNLLATYSFLQKEELVTVLNQADLAQQKWVQAPIKQRLQCLITLETQLLQHTDRLAQLAALEIGKPITQAKAEVLKCISLCQYYAEHAEKILTPEMHYTEKGNVQICFEPMGVVLGIFPWNFPYWQVLRSLLPTVVSGNGMLIKPAPNMPQCALALQHILNACGFEPNLINTVFIDEEQIAKLIEDDKIAAVTLTGSNKAGSTVAAIAGKNIKKTVLELGGSDPMIIFDDADLERHIDEMAMARFQNNGQTCVAAKRFLVQENIAELFTQKLIEAIKKYKVGNPLHNDTVIGPLARKDLTLKLNEQVNETIKKGATLLWQMNVDETSECFYAPAILSNIPSGSSAYTEELFGPVVSLFTFKDINQAAHIANNTMYGLGAAI